MQILDGETKRTGKRITSIALTDEFSILKNDISPILNRMDSRFKLSTKKSHSFQCDCDKEEPCTTFLVIEF